MAKVWGMKDVEVTYLLRNHKIPGAKKEGKQWLIPDITPKPIDGRYKYNQPSLLPVPLGISDFRSLSKEFYSYII